jgi:hypothetical protein
VNTTPELIFKALCDKHQLPFKYTGDGSLWIGNVNPDFVESTGKKIAIEIFGTYWHSPLINPHLHTNARLDYRQRTLKKHRWKLIVLWDTDLLRNDAEQFVLHTLRRSKAV